MKFKLCSIVFVLVLVAGLGTCAPGVKGGSCGAGHFRCSSGACIAESYVCDGENDCDDGLDESYCPNRRECDSSKEHRCSEGSAWKCIPRTDVCDGEKDCSDGSDEDNCPVKNACLESAGEHTCSGSSQCIPKIWVCDGEQDCEFGQDEVNCTALTPPAPESCPAGHVRCSTECVAKTVLCRSALDCVGATVEQLCFLFSAKTPAPAVQEVATPRSEPEQVVVAYSEEQEAVIDSEPAPVEPQQMIVYSEPQQIVVQPVTEPSEPEHDDSHSDLDQPLFPTEPTEPEHDDSNSDLDQPLFPTESPEQDSESGANEQPESSAEPERALFESDPDTLAEPNRALFSEPDFDRVKKPKLTPFNFTELEHELLNDNKPESDKNKKSDLPPSNSTDLGDESINATQSKSDQAKPTVEIPPIQVDAVNTIVEIAERMDIPPALVDRKGLQTMVRKSANRITNKAVQLGISEPQNAKAEEGEFKKFLQGTISGGPNAESLTLLASVMHSEEEVRYLRQKLKFAAFERDLGLFLLRHRNILPGLKVNPEVTQVETKSKKGQ